jgi:hypothetical protein
MMQRRIGRKGRVGGRHLLPLVGENGRSGAWEVMMECEIRALGGRIGKWEALVLYREEEGW